MRGITEDSLCYRCQRTKRAVWDQPTQYGWPDTDCTNACLLISHARIFDCGLRVEECETFKEKEEKEDDPRLDD